nr:hypothetical protein [Tanacetum cinerariifolium]
MSTQQDIYAAGSESRPPMLNKENYIPWSSRLLRYAKSRPNGKLIHSSILNGPYVRKMIPEPGDANRNTNITETSHLQTDDELSDKELKQISILNGPYVRKMIPEPCDTNRDINITETSHLQTDDELSDKELKQIEADDQATQTILLGLPEDIYAAIDSCETAQEIWLRPEWSRHVTIIHQTKDLHTADYTQLYDFLKYNQKEIAQPGMNMGQDRQIQMVGGNGGNQLRQYTGKNAGNPARYNDVIGNQVIQNAVQNPRVQNVGNPNGLMGVQGNRNQNQIGNGNLVAARAEGNAAGQNGNHIRCYNCRGIGH